MTTTIIVSAMSGLLGLSLALNVIFYINMRLHKRRADYLEEFNRDKLCKHR